MLRAIAAQASLATRRAMRSATSMTRRQMPIGLAVTKVGRPLIPTNRPPPINRSRAMAKPLRSLKSYVLGINRIVPVAYKNRNWRFYSQLNRGQIIFFNTRNGAPFMIHKKTGERIPLAPRAAWVTANNLARIYKQPRRPRNTWNEYMKRMTRIKEHVIKGQPKRNAKRNAINAAVARYVGGNYRALNAYSVPNLAWWAKSTNWMSMNGAPYVKRRGQWERYGGARVNKNIITNNIMLAHSLR
jgi:hypothetical protein